MKEPTPALLSTVLSLALMMGMCPATAFAETADEAQETAIGESAETGEAAEEPATDIVEEQPAEGEGQFEEPSNDAATEPVDDANAGEAESVSDATEVPEETVNGAEIAMPTEETTAAEGETAEQTANEAVAQVATCAHTATAEQNGVTFTLGWDDAPAGAATTFHVTQAGGSSAAKVRMDVPTYWDTDGSFENVCDPSRNQWSGYYELGSGGHDFSFELTASGTYRINFYFMDADSNVWYLRITAVVEVNDEARPSVTQIVNDAVAQYYSENMGSEYDVALWLHDWAMDQLEYDHSLNYSSAESGLTRGLGTCESYQRIYAKLLNAAGIANGRIEGNGHTWNAVRIDGKWCQMDLTWDDTSDNWYGDLGQRHLYFGLTDELMAIAHSDHAKNYQSDGYAYRSTDLSNDYFVRNGKADEWAQTYAERIQQRLDVKEASFSIDADNGAFPPSISGIQNALVAYAMNQRDWNTAGGSAMLTAASNVTTVSNYQWSAVFDFTAEYPETSAPAADISQAEIAVPDVEYSGATLEPAATVTLNGVRLERGKDYAAAYSDNVTPGLAEVVVSGIGSYTGSILKTFEITAADAMTRFVAGLYAGGTNRRADTGGFAYWLSVTKEVGYDDAAACFLSSSEVVNRAQTNEALVSAVFDALLGREPDSGEQARWASSLEGGTAPYDFARAIASSREFVLSHPSVSVGEFVENMYREALGRPSDEEGSAYWTSVIVDRASARNAIEAAFASTEFSLKGLDPKKTVRRIYRSALLREPDESGLEYYSGLIAKGATSAEIARQVASSQEFDMVCVRCGLR